MTRTILDRMFKWKRPKVILGTEPLNGFDNQELLRGHTYLVKEPKPKCSFQMFASLIKGKCFECEHSEAFHCESIGCEECTLPCPCKNCKRTRAQGLCFTMYSPRDVRFKYTLQITPIFWISNSGANNISPTDLEMMANVMSTFLKKSKNPVLLLDGVEYLIAINGFDSMLKFLHDIQEWVILHRARFILPISPMALEAKELAIIERHMQVILTE